MWNTSISTACFVVIRVPLSSDVVVRGWVATHISCYFLDKIFSADKFWMLTGDLSRDDYGVTFKHV
eukprot:9013817-Ditylum_brightwellii.AAC.1